MSPQKRCLLTLLLPLALTASLMAQKYDIRTLSGKVASVNGTAGLQIRFSAFIEQEADTSDLAINPTPSTPITPTFVLSSPWTGQASSPPTLPLIKIQLALRRMRQR